jgi:hypothetical protein
MPKKVSKINILDNLEKIFGQLKLNWYYDIKNPYDCIVFYLSTINNILMIVSYWSNISHI